MKYFMVESTVSLPAPVGRMELQRLIKEHQHYLQKGLAEGWILVSGPKATGSGGVILLKGSSRQEIEAYLDEDPMKRAGVQGYKVVEFCPYDCQQVVKGWFN